MLQITFNAEDYLALFTGIGSNDVKLPQRTITRADFPSCPVAHLGQPVPILYGDLREAFGTVLDAPRLQANYTRGMVWAGDFVITDGGRSRGYYATQWRGGWGLADTDPVTALAVADASGGTIDQGDVVWVNRFYAMAIAFDATGVAQTPYPAWPATVQAASETGATVAYDDYSADDRQINITVTWPAAATTGWTCKVYLGWNYYSIRWDQVITLSHPSTVASFDAFKMGPPLGPGRDLSTGAAFVTYTPPPGIYTVRAYDANGESSDSETALCPPAPSKLPHYLEWAAVTGATGYRVYQWVDWAAIGEAQVAYGAPIRYWDVGNTTSWTGYPEGDGSTAYEETDTPARGIPVRHVGQLTDTTGDNWEAFLVAGHACQSVTAAYLDGEAIQSSEYGATLALPGQTDFDTLFTTVYRDINSNRYTLVYLRGLLAEAVLVDRQVLTVDVAGIESVGDGSGTLITDIYAQYEHLLRNWVLRNYTSGAWATVGPTWGDTPYDVDVLDGASFLAAQGVADARISGGYTGAFGIGLDDFGTVREWVARLNQSADCYCGFSRKSQFVVKMLDASYTAVLAAPSFTADLGILRDTFAIKDDALAIQNQIVTQYDYHWAAGSWRRGLTREDTAAQAAIGETRPYTLNLYATRNAIQAADIAARRLERRKFPYRVVSFEADMGGLTVDIGDLVRLSHPDGLGASGWTDRAAWVLRHEFVPNRFTVQLDCLDIDWLVNLRLLIPSGAIETSGQAVTAAEETP